MPQPIDSTAKFSAPSVFRPRQVRLRAACLGVKIRAENGLANVVGCLSDFVRMHQASQLTASHAAPQRSPVIGPLSRVESTEESEKVDTEGRSHKGCPVDNEAGISGGGGMGTETVKETEESLMLHEMPNGVKVWCGSRGKEEAFFIYGEVFEDRTYARMGVRVQDGDTVWDVGERKE